MSGNAKCKVYVEGTDRLVKEMFARRGYVITNHLIDAELVCFTGGPDVTPMLYDQGKHTKTMSDPRRDETCFSIWVSTPSDIPFVGICRGAQFLNVVNGGTLYQHVDNHNLKGTHPAKDVSDDRIYEVTSTHHQMMIPSEDAEIILVADEASVREKYADTEMKSLKWQDTEACFYEDTNNLCFQPHPEYVDYDHECQELFFLLLEQYLER